MNDLILNIEFGTLLRVKSVVVRIWLNDITLCAKSFTFLSHPANVLFNYQENMLHDTFFFISISRNVFDFDHKHFTTDLPDERCFLV